MVKDGIPFVSFFVLAALLLSGAGWYVGGPVWWGLALFCLLLAAFMAWFFRDPERAVPTAPDLIVSPADGKVTRVESLLPGAAASPQVVSIFLSPLDVHINRAPLAGRVTAVNYTKGRFRMATKEDASLVNEQNAITIEGERVTIVCKQIAGILARRIVCWSRPGDTLARGERFGLIKFSSRTDLIMPPEVEILVQVGERVQGGVTIIGKVRP